MEKITLAASSRSETKAKALRNQGVITGTVYGHGFPSISLQIAEKDFIDVYKKAGGTSLVDLQVEGKSFPVLIHQKQIHPITRKTLNVEFYKVSLTEKISAKVPLKLTGTAPGLKLGGFLLEALSEVEVESLPQDLPKEILVDVSVLAELNAAIVVKDLVLPANVKVVTDGDTIVVKIQPPQEEKAEDIEAAAPTAPELIVKEKKVDEEAAEATH